MIYSPPPFPLFLKIVSIRKYKLHCTRLGMQVLGYLHVHTNKWPKHIHVYVGENRRLHVHVRVHVCLRNFLIVLRGKLSFFLLETRTRNKINFIKITLSPKLMKLCRYLSPVIFTRICWFIYPLIDIKG